MSMRVTEDLPLDLTGLDWDIVKTNIHNAIENRFPGNMTSDVIIRYWWPRRAGRPVPTAMLLESLRDDPQTVIAAPEHRTFIRLLPQTLSSMNIQFSADAVYGSQLAERLREATIIATPRRKQRKTETMSTFTDIGPIDRQMIKDKIAAAWRNRFFSLTPQQSLKHWPAPDEGEETPSAETLQALLDDPVSILTSPAHRQLAKILPRILTVHNLTVTAADLYGPALAALITESIPGPPALEAQAPAPAAAEQPFLPKTKKKNDLPRAAAKPAGEKRRRLIEAFQRGVGSPPLGSASPSAPKPQTGVSAAPIGKNGPS